MLSTCHLQPTARVLLTGQARKRSHVHGTPGASPDPLLLAPSRVKLAEMVLAEMLDVPQVLHGLTILGLQVDCAGPGPCVNRKQLAVNRLWIAIKEGVPLNLCCFYFYLCLSALRLRAWSHSLVLSTSRGLDDSASMRHIRSGHEPDPLWASRTSEAHVLVFKPS